jgi:hypothetical protein
MMGLSRSKVETAIEVVIHGGFPWVVAAPGSQAFDQRFRHLARRLIMRRWPSALRPFAAIAMMAVWPFTALREARRTAGNALPGALGAVDRSRLAWDATLCALKHNVPPLEYLAYRMFEPECEAIDAWVVGDEGTRVFGSLAGAEAIALSDDKHAFAEFCADAGIPGIATLALFEAGGGVQHAGPAALPAANLVFKPRRAARTEGIEPWFFRDGLYHRSSGDPNAQPREPGPPLDVEALSARLRGLTERYADMLVQPMLLPHPSLAAISGDGVPTARIVTGRWPDGRVRIINALAQRPMDGSFVSQGSFFALIDLESGRIRDDARGQVAPVFYLGTLDRGFVGRALPDWADASAHVLRGHRAFPEPVALLGWDVAFTDEGPVVIETNVGLSFYQFQMAEARPALRGPLGDLMKAWL